MQNFTEKCIGKKINLFQVNWAVDSRKLLTFSDKFKNIRSFIHRSLQNSWSAFERTYTRVILAIINFIKSSEKILASLSFWNEQFRLENKSLHDKLDFTKRCSPSLLSRWTDGKNLLKSSFKNFIWNKTQWNKMGFEIETIKWSRKSSWLDDWTHSYVVRGISSLIVLALWHF